MLDLPTTLLAFALCIPSLACQAENSIPIQGLTMTGGGKPMPWRLVTQQNNGQIIVSRYETKSDCEDAKKRATHEPATTEEKAYALYFQKKASDFTALTAPLVYMKIGTDIANIECLDW